MIARTHLVMHKRTCRIERIFINDAISEDFRAHKIPFDLSIVKHFFKQHVPLFCIVKGRE